METQSETYKPIQLECTRCGHTWFPRIANVHQCPKCRAFDFMGVTSPSDLGGKNCRYITSKKRQEILKRDNFTCQRCGATDIPLEVHHLTYDMFQGREVPDRYMVTLCKSCHNMFRRKVVKLRHTFLRQIIPSRKQRILESFTKFLSNWRFYIGI